MKTLAHISFFVFVSLFAVFFLTSCKKNRKELYNKDQEMYKFRVELSLDRPDLYEMKVGIATYSYYNSRKQVCTQWILGGFMNSRSIGPEYYIDKFPEIVEFDVHKNFHEFLFKASAISKQYRDEEVGAIVTMKIYVNDKLLYSGEQEEDVRFLLSYDFEQEKYFAEFGTTTQEIKWIE